MEHIVEFLRSMDEPEMADEVANAHNRLECYSTGITNEIIEALRSVAEKSLAELSALKAENEWQPIETAPKDGSHFIGAEFLDDKWWYEEIWWSYSWKFSGGNFLTYPTHWMPLPTPPKRSMEGV